MVTVYMGGKGRHDFLIGFFRNQSTTAVDWNAK